MYNRVTLIGRLVRDVEKNTVGAKGTSVAKFTIAVEDSYGANKETDYIPVVVWGKLADICAEHIGKGRLVLVGGKIKIRKWETPQGEKRTATGVKADVVKFLDKAGGNRAEYRSEEPQPQDNKIPADEIDLDGDDPYKDDY